MHCLKRKYSLVECGFVAARATKLPRHHHRNCCHVCDGEVLEITDQTLHDILNRHKRWVEEGFVNIEVYAFCVGLNHGFEVFVTFARLPILINRQEFLLAVPQPSHFGILLYCC